MAKIEGMDKMVLEDYIKDIVLQTLSAIKEVEKKNPDWKFSGIEINAEAVLKPAKVDGQTKVIVDLDEPQKFPRSVIPIKVNRID